MCVWICVVGLTAECTRRNAGMAQSRYLACQSVLRSGSFSRSAASSIWMTLMPAASRSSTSSRMARASCWVCCSCVMSSRGQAPVEDGHRAGEHALHHMVGAGLRVGGPFHRDRVGAGDVAPHDRRLDAARAVGLHPGVLGEQEAVEVLAEVLDHVVALELAVNQHIEADLLLVPDAGVDLGLHELVVFGLGDLALTQLGAFGANLLGLREGADGGGGQQRQAKGDTLLLLTLGAPAGARSRRR